MLYFKNSRKNKFVRMFKKKNKIQKFYYKNEEFIKYCLISLVCTIVLYVIFFVVDSITGGNYLLANFLSYTISFTILFIWDRKLFKSKPIRKKDKISQIISFIIIRVIGFPLDSLVLHILINNFHIKNMIAKIFGSLIMFIYNYITNKLFIFKKNNNL